MQNSIQKSKFSTVSFDLNINKAFSQSRISGILCSSEHGKLYFEFLKIFSVPENPLPCRGKMLPKSAFFNKTDIAKGFYS